MRGMLKAFCIVLSLTFIAAVESSPQEKLQDDPGVEEILLEDFDSYGLRWQPLLDFENATLRVVGRQGLVWERLFHRGEDLDYGLTNLEGVPVPDGAYTYEWRVASSPSESAEGTELKVQSGHFRIQGGVAQSLAKSAPEEGFPLVTNPGGNHFVGNLTTDTGICVGCADGDLATVVDSDGTTRGARLRLKGASTGIIFDDETNGEYWRIHTHNGNLSINDLPTGTETGLTAPFNIQPRAPSRSLRIASSGNIGLGTGTPAASLHVLRDDGTAQMLVEEFSLSTAVRTQLYLKNNGAPRFALENTDSGIEWSFQQSSVGNFLISKEGSGGPEMQVYATGRVRMGPGGATKFDLAPNGNLTIAGSLIANGSTFPDYVFEPGYSLMPLADLRTFIQRNKHLPHIPSADEVENQSGHDMTELQIRLLEKIEELTLYTLNQDQQLQERETQLERQQAQIESLKLKVSDLENLQVEFTRIRAKLENFLK